MPDRLLVADDSLTIQRVIELAFADENIEVLTVSSGEEAIRQIDVRSPAIVLADTRMPERSGYEIAEFVSSKPAGDQMPVVLMSGAFEPLMTAGCVRRGAIPCSSSRSTHQRSSRPYIRFWGVARYGAVIPRGCQD